MALTMYMFIIAIIQLVPTTSSTTLNIYRLIGNFDPAIWDTICRKTKVQKGFNHQKYQEAFHFASNAVITIINADLIDQYDGIHRTCKNFPHVIRYMCQF